MILKLYGTTLQSVTPDFDARAMTEIGFRRDRKSSMPLDEFERDYELVEERSMTAESAGAVQDEAEQALLADLLAQVEAFEAELESGDVLRLQNTAEDYPKTRDDKKPVVVGGKNLIHFIWRIDPPLRMARFRPRG